MKEAEAAKKSLCKFHSRNLRYNIIPTTFIALSNGMVSGKSPASSWWTSPVTALVDNFPFNETFLIVTAIAISSSLRSLSSFPFLSFACSSLETFSLALDFADAVLAFAFDLFGDFD